MPCRPHALPFAYAMLWNIDVRCGLEKACDDAQTEHCAAVDLAELTATRIAGAAPSDTRTSLFSPLAKAL
jgi:hypothetical protein